MSRASLKWNICHVCSPNNLVRDEEQEQEEQEEQDASLAPPVDWDEVRRREGIVVQQRKFRESIFKPKFVRLVLLLAKQKMGIAFSKL